MSFIKVQGYESLAKDTRSNAIVNTNKSEFQLYMKRRKERNLQGDKMRKLISFLTNT